MVKYIVFLIAGLVLSGGTLLDVTPASSVLDEVCSGDGLSSACSIAEEVAFDKGFPFSYVTEIDQEQIASQIKDVSAEDIADDGISMQNFIANWGFWAVIAFLGYVAFKKLQDTAGTLVIMGAGVAAGLVYFGVLAL